MESPVARLIFRSSTGAAVGRLWRFECLSFIDMDMNSAPLYDWGRGTLPLHGFPQLFEPLTLAFFAIRVRKRAPSLSAMFCLRGFPRSSAAPAGSCVPPVRGQSRSEMNFSGV